MSENRGMLKTLSQEREYPDPRTLPPQPSWQQPRPLLTLSELIPKQYVSTTARIVFLKTTERQDTLGSKMVFSGILEDSTFKTPFVSHRITFPLIRNSQKYFSLHFSCSRQKILQKMRSTSTMMVCFVLAADWH
ncbi:MAG: hypothetical protein WCF23_20640 [Candidatus Nitrosopolaris sp.]